MMAGMEAILWDMDGTLVDTEPRWGEATYAIAAEMGRDLTPEIRETTIGGSAPGTIRICARWAGLDLDSETERHWIDRLYTIVSELFAEDLPLRPGIPELLSSGTPAVPMMVVTNTYRVLTDRVLDTIGADHFVGSVCGDEVSEGKPAPEAYRTACERLGLPPDDCLVIEDSTNGMRSAVAAGCRVLAVPSPGNPVPPGAAGISDLCPDHHDLGGLGVTDLRELWGRIGAAAADVPQ